MDPKNPVFPRNLIRMNLPFGYRFDPTSVELIQYYLIPKIKGEELPSNYVDVLDNLYEFDPHQLPYSKSMYVKQNQAFFFTLDQRKNSTEESSQIRATPNGYWKVYEDNFPVYDQDGEVIGFKTKLLHYDFDGNKTYWKMIEYKPHPSQVPATSANANNYIVCKVKQWLKG